jgi:hypothetical protein
VILARYHALGKIVLVIGMLERLENQRGQTTKAIYLPMLRLDIADYPRGQHSNKRSLGRNDLDAVLR